MNDRLDQFPVTSLAPGTQVLGVSPPMLGLRRLMDRYVEQGLDDGEGCVIVTTTQDAASVVASIEDRVDDEAFDRLGVIDATSQEPAPSTLPCRVESISSPADLTGIGIALSKLLESFVDADLEGYRVLVDSVSVLLVYSGFERVYQFLHTVTNQLDTIDGSSVWLLSGDTDQAQIDRFVGLFDGVLEARESPEGPEYRFRRSGGAEGWHPLPVAALPDADPGDGRAVAETDPDAGGAGTSRPGLASAASLREIIDAIDAAGPTLTLCNFTGDEEVEEAIRAYFRRHNVTVRSATLSTDTPSDVALLHRDSDVLAASGVPEVYAAIDVDLSADADEVSPLVEPAVLEHVHRNEYTVEDGTKLDMVRISRLIETRALHLGRGTLHAGFQRLERIRDEFDTRELYEAIARAGVSVHLYGRPGDVPNEDLYTVHPIDSGEIADAWFVVYDGGGEDVQKVAELCRETRPEHYSGFWTYQPAVVDTIASYLTETYAAE